MGVVYYLMERLRQLMSTTWDYCVLWKLNEDPWSLECVDCCCGGTYQSSQNSEEELTLSMPCKDVMFQHQRTTSCQLLSQLPPSLPLDGINAEVLISNLPRWMNNAKMTDLSTNPEVGITVGTKVLIPVPGGLVEFFTSKMVQEDQSLVDFVVSQCSSLLEQEAITNKINLVHPNTSLPNNQTDGFPPFSPSTGLSNLNLSCADATADRIRICNSAMNFLQQFSYLTETRSTKDDLLLDGSKDHPDHSQQQFGGLEGSIENNENPLGNGNENHFHQQQQNEDQEKGPLKHELGRPDSGSDSDPIDDEDDSKYTRRRNGKGNQSKNLEAERKRRKKLNERLYTLRSLVPKISKLDRAAILGDAIEYVMELQQQEKELQNELEQNSDDEGFSSCLISNASQQQSSNIPMEYSSLIGVNSLAGVDNYENGEASNGYQMGTSSKCQGENSLKRSHDNSKTSSYDKGQQMEVQVEVAHLEGNEFFIKVFGEQKRGGFVRLMEALDSLGLEITTVNVTSCISLVSYVFTVEKKDSEIVQAEYLRESLLELTRNQSGDWSEMAKAQGVATTGHHPLDQYQQQYFHPHQFHHFQ